MKLGMIGLGRMGGSMAERLRLHGHEVVGFDHSGDARDVTSLDDLVAVLGEPGERTVWCMVPAGEPTESTVNRLAELLAPDDLVIDGGNSNWHDTRRRAEALAEKGIRFVDCGTSGGVWGLKLGYCLMVGGAAEDVARAQAAFDALAPEGGFAHVGKVGTGHFTKMVHNGIEYGLMQAYAEGYEVLDESGLDIDALAALAAWRNGSVVRSWLLDLLVAALERTPRLEGIKDVAADSGEGRWTVTEAVRLGVAVPVMSAALFACFVSQEDSSTAMKVIAALRQEFGGHAVEPEGP